jgi:methylthioxylose transferase
VNRDLRHDLSTAAAAALLVVTAAVVGTVVQHRDGTLRVGWPPLLADWHPHVGPGTPAALAVAAAVVAYGPSVTARLRWRTLLLATWGTALAWTWSLALVDGWHRGVAEQLTTAHEYLRVIDRFQDIPATLRDFSRHILLQAPDNWPAHVAGHPPGATLTFVLLDRIGLGGGGWAGAWCITVGTTAAVAVLVAVRALSGERLARRAAPFLVLAPAAVWVGTSADGYFAAVAAWAVAFLALAVTGHRPGWTGFAAGLLFGWTVYLSYGLTLFAVIAGTALLLGSHRARPFPFVLAGFLVVPVAFTAMGFDWWEAYRLLVIRYYQGVGGVRPYGYWVWANLACTVLIVGPATVAGLRRAGVAVIRQPDRASLRLALLAFAALLALLVADLSGMSKAETERIWLPFALWLLPAGALVPGPRGWLAAQAVLALLLNHLLLTGW